MIVAPRLDDERARLAELERLGVLDTPREATFDDMVEVAAAACNAPIALLSFLDHSRLWFKAAVGTDLREMPRDISFCAHTLAARDLLVVPNAAEDERFADNPFVVGTLNIRFYAGVPIGKPLPVGVLCVADRVPRTLDTREAEVLRVVGHHLERLLSQRSAGRDNEWAWPDATLTGDRSERLVPLLGELRHDVAWLRGRLGPGGVGPSPAAVASTLEEMAALLDDLTRSTHVANVQAAPPRPTGLVPTLSWLCATYGRRMHGTCQLDIAPAVDDLAPGPALGLCALLQEALEATAQPSLSHPLSVNVSLGVNVVVLALRHHGAPPGASVALRHRARSLGGGVDIETTETGATLITAWLPLTP